MQMKVSGRSIHPLKRHPGGTKRSGLNGGHFSDAQKPYLGATDLDPLLLIYMDKYYPESYILVTVIGTNI